MSECSGGDWNGSETASFGWLAGVVVGAARNWATSALLWNLALDGDGGPHLGGCDDCHGVVTVTAGDGSSRSGLGSINRSLEFDLLALASRAAPRGSVRVPSQASPGTVSSGSGTSGTVSSGSVSSVAFVAADGQRSLLIHNRAGSDQAVSVYDGGPAFTVTLPARALAAIRWRP
jgi:glucosylceramidase